MAALKRCRLLTGAHRVKPLAHKHCSSCSRSLGVERAIGGLPTWAGELALSGGAAVCNAARQAKTYHRLVTGECVTPSDCTCAISVSS